MLGENQFFLYASAGQQDIFGMGIVGLAVEVAGSLKPQLPQQDFSLMSQDF